MNEDLKLGDVVVLNSGGNSMTVTYILQRSDPGEVFVECSWFEGPFGNQKKMHSCFPIEALRKISQQSEVATSKEIKESLRKIKSLLPSERQSGLEELVYLKAADELTTLISNKNVEVRQLAAIGLARLQHFPALPQLIDGLNVIEGRNARDLIPNVENLLALFGESALNQIIKKLPEKVIHRHRKKRWVTGIANVIINEKQANQLLNNSLGDFLQMVESRSKKAIGGHRFSSIIKDPSCTPLEVILEAVIASDKSVDPVLLVQAATAYVTYNHHKIWRRLDFSTWLAKSTCNQSIEVIEMVGKWASEAVQLYQYEIAEFGSSEDCVHDVIYLLETAVELHAVSHEEIDEYIEKASDTDLIKELHKMKARRITDA